MSAGKKYKAFFLLGLTLFAFSFLVEFSMRKIKGAPPSVDKQFSHFVSDDDVGFRHESGSVLKGTSASGEYEYEYRHNSAGFRDQDRNENKNRSVFRIIGLGDSFTYGAGVSFEETYLRRLEKLLNSRPGLHPDVEVINVATSFSWPERQRKTFDKFGKKLSPDLVLAGIMPNDVLDTKLSSTVSVDTDGKLISVGSDSMWGTFAAHSMFLRNVNATIHDYQSQIYWKATYLPYIFNDVWNKIENEFRRLNEDVVSGNARLALVYIPQQGPWREYHSVPETRVKDMAARNSIHFISTLDTLKKGFSDGEKLYYPVDGHCTPSAHRLIAEKVFHYLEDNRLVP